MRRFKHDNHTIYIAESRDASRHYVPEKHIKEYLELRLNEPVICFLFDRLEDAEQFALLEERLGPQVEVDPEGDKCHTYTKHMYL